jgi:hypothetical protein
VRAPRKRAIRLRALPRLLAAVLLVASLFGIADCGSASRHRATRPVAGAAGASRVAFGLTEDNAALLWSPGAAPVITPGAGAAGTHSLSERVQLAREELTALHPRYLRLLIDWAVLQPQPNRPAALEAPASGCARTVAPCPPYGGVREELAAIASQQRASGGFEVVVDIFGTPAWAARAPSGCERGGLGASSRPPSVAGIAAYRALIHELIVLGASAGVALEWWSPWNEPNDPTFLSPQRASCASGMAALAPSAYGELARAMAAQLKAEGGQRHMLLGELNAYRTASPDRTSIAEFVLDLPRDVTCLGDAWSVHAYAGRDPAAAASEPVRVLEAALDARGGCARGARVWVTEAGAGAPHPGDPRPLGGADERAGCLALFSELVTWSRDPRVSAVFQYTFRDDPAFPVGLTDPSLKHIYPAYRLWLAWLRAAAASGSPPPPASACA